MPSVAFLVPVRNKEKHLPRLLESVLAQTYSPMEILLSDQGSTDGSRGLIANAVRSYNGPNKVRQLDCPITEFQGMMGLNTHFDWLHTQTDAELIFFACADDLVNPRRVEKMLPVFMEKNPSMVMSGMWFADHQPDGSLKYGGETAWEPGVDRFITAEECYRTLIGSSTAHAWWHEFYDRVGGLSGVGGEDYVLPFLAILDRGAWYMQERLYTYIRYADEDNTGLEGILRAKKDPNEILQLEENMHFQATAALYSVVQKMNKAGLEKEEGVQALAQHILDRAASWQATRTKMALQKIPPINLRT